MWRRIQLVFSHGVIREACLRLQVNLETVVAFLLRLRRPGLSRVDRWLRPKPARMAPFITGPDTGFRDVCEEALTVPRVWSGTPEELWAYQQEISTLCHPLFDSIPTNSRSKIDAEASALLSRFQSGSVLSVPVNIIVVSGKRPAGEKFTC